MWILFSFALVGAALLLLWLWDKGPLRGIRQRELSRYIEALLYRGYDRGFLLIQPPRGSEFIQFSKYIGDTKAGIQFDFPRASWSAPHYERLQGLLRSGGYEFERQPTSSKGVREFVVVDLEQDVDRATQLARVCLSRLFGCDEEASLRLQFSNVSPRDERIGF